MIHQANTLNQLTVTDHVLILEEGWEGVHCSVLTFEEGTGRRGGGGGGGDIFGISRYLRNNNRFLRFHRVIETRVHCSVEIHVRETSVYWSNVSYE